MTDEDDPYWDYDDDADCWNCGGEGYVYGCSWDWQCDTYDEGEQTCLCWQHCSICNPPKPDPQLQEVLRQALAQGMSAGTAETAPQAQGEARQSGPSGCAQNTPEEPA